MGIKMTIPELPRKKKYHMDLDKLSSYVSKAVLVCNPNKRRVASTRRRRFRLSATSRRITISPYLSDEIYLHYVYDNNKFIMTPRPTIRSNFEGRAIEHHELQQVSA